MKKILLFIFVTIGFSTILTQSIAQVQVYDIPAANLINQGSFCDGTGANRYNGCSNTPFGFQWTDVPLGPSVASITVQFSIGINCNGAGQIFPTTLNASASPNVTITNSSCACTPSGITLYSLTFVPTGYNIGGSNNFQIMNPITCLGFSQNGAIGGNYARVTVTYSGPSPEINLVGNGLSIVDGDVTPNPADFTDFGTQTVCTGGVNRTFTIQNTGAANLTISSTTITGPNAADFSIVSAPASTVAVGGSTTFQVSFTPSAAGVRSATINIANNDLDESNYDFAIQGTGGAEATPPVANCQPVTIFLDASGNASTTAAAVNNGSTDNCAIASMSLSQSAFTCSNIGVNAVTFTVVDNSGNSSTCNTTVTVVDNLNPIANCQNITVNLDGSGNATITPSQINNGSYDLPSSGVPINYNYNFDGSTQGWTSGIDGNTCFGNGSSNFWGLQTNAFAGSNSFGTPNTGNLGAENSFIISPPLNLTGNITVAFQSFSNNETGYPCAYDVEFIEISTDNGATWTTLNGGFVPNLNDVFNDSQWRSISFNTTVATTSTGRLRFRYDTGDGCCGGTGTNDGWYVDNVSITNSVTSCFPVTLALDNSTFNCSNVGANTVTLTVTDANSNSSTCTATVTVVDNIVPAISCNSNITVNNTPGVCGAVVTYTAPVGTDNCAGVTTTQIAGLPTGSTFPIGTTTNTFRVVDAGMNSSTCSFTVTVIDVESPVISCPANQTVNNTPGTCGAVVTFAAPVASDNCPIPTIMTYDIPLANLVGVVFNCGAGSLYNNCGGSGFGFNWTDLGSGTATNIQIQLNNGVECNGPGIPYVTTLNGINQPSFVSGSNWCSCSLRDNVMTYNLPVANYVVGGSNQFLINGTSCWGLSPTSLLGNNYARVTVAYSTPGGAVQTAGLPSGSIFPVGTTVNTWLVTDGAGNTSTYTQTIIVNDTENPTINCPSNTTVNSDPGVCGAVVNYTIPSASDNCSGTGAYNYSSCTYSGLISQTSPAVIVSGDDVTSSNIPVAFPFNFNGVAANNIFASTNGYIMVDVNNGAGCCSGGFLPNPSFPNQINLGWMDWITTVSYSVEGTAPNRIMVFNYSGGEFGCGGSINAQIQLYETSNEIRLVSANVGNGCHTVTQGININGTTAYPVPGRNSVGGVSWSNDCQSFIPGLTATLVSGLAPGSNFPVGTTTNVYMATDAHGNSSTCSFTVTVNDNQAPSITCPANITQSNTAGSCGANVSFTPGATDNCPGVTITSVPASGSFFPIGTTTVTVTATDASLNSSTCTFTVTINDTQAPALTCPANITQGNTPGLCGANVSFTPTASDNCPGVTITSIPASGSFFPLGTTTVTVTATDASANSSTCTFTVTVNDTQAPTVTCPSNITQNNTPGSCGANVSFTPTASDNCGSTTITTSFASGSFFPVGTTTVTVTATDAAMNSSTCTFTITINDVQAPTVTCPANITMPNNPGQCGRNVAFSPTASDNCSATITSIPSSGSFFPVGTTTVAVTATDASGNSSTCSFTVTINDTQAPTISCAANMIVNTSCIPATVTLTPPTASDNCGGVMITNNHPSTTYPAGITTVIWTATDVHGNSATCSQTVNVTSPEADVLGNGYPINNASNIISLTNLTDFGNVPVCSTTVTRTYVLKNTGTGTLNLTGLPKIILTGLNVADFSVVQPLVSSLVPGASVSFQVTFDPSAAGYRNARVTIPNNDCNESGYYYAIRGNGVACSGPALIPDPSGVTQASGNNNNEEGGSTMGVEGNNELGALIYPNPSNGVFTLQLSQLPRGNTEIRLVNNLGQVIYSSRLMVETSYYDFSYLAAGTYHIQITSPEKTFTKTIIITQKY